MSSGWRWLPGSVYRPLATFSGEPLEDTPQQTRQSVGEIENLRADIRVLEEVRRRLGSAMRGFEKGRAARVGQIKALTRWLLQERGKSGLGPGDKALLRVVVDLTPLLPGGENGGAKPMTLELIRRMASRSPKTKFILLTLMRSFDELAAFKQPNVQVVEVVDKAASLDLYAVRLVRTRRGLERRTRTFWSKLRWLTPDRGPLVRHLGGSVLFCPFTAPSFAQAGIPTVSVIHDLQYADYPQYFEELDRSQRHQNFTEACRRADRLVCVSDFVRRRVLEESGLPQERLTTVHTQLAHRLPVPAPEVSASVLARLRLTPGRYFLYPANFWKHKNHEILFVAMRLFTARLRHSDLKLVCTGAPGERRDFLQSAAERMGLRDRVVFPGYLSESDFSALMRGCLALVYPSLYEGFGMPVIEAQAIGKPVLCGNLTSLPEVAGQAALIFDPRLPESIVAAMQRIESDLTVRQDLIRNGFENVKRFVNADAMASQYLRTLGEVVQGASSNHRELRHG
jgi:glycosyltransferase involved in cell wall biosynthesis